MKKLLIFLAGILIIAVALSGCSPKPATTPNEDDPAGQTESEPKEEEQAALPLYLLSLPSGDKIIDSKGQVILSGKQQSLQIIKDASSGEERFLVMKKFASNGERDEYGYPANEQDYSQLYDLQGNLLIDWQECSYQSVWQNYLLAGDYRANDFSLLDTSTFDPKIEHVFYPDFIEQYMLICQLDAPHSFKVLDKAGKTIHSFDEIDYMSSAYGKYYLARNLNDENALFGMDFQPIIDFATQDITTLAGDLASVRQVSDAGTQNLVVDLLTGEQIFSYPGDQYRIDYCDRNVVVIIEQTDAENYITTSYLLDMKGQLISEKYESIYQPDIYADQKYFIAANYAKTDNPDSVTTYTVLDETGATMFSKEGDLSIGYLGNDHFSLNSYSMEASPASIVDKTGAEVFSGKYTNINPSYFDVDNSQTEPYLMASYQTSQGIWMTDILDKKGQVVVDNLKSLIYFDGKIIVGSKGFSAGLLNLNGEWVYQESIFNNLVND